MAKRRTDAKAGRRAGKGLLKKMKGPEPPLFGSPKRGPVPTEPPVFTELERLGVVVPVSARGRRGRSGGS